MKQNELMFKSFHGIGNYSSHLYLFMDGKGVFAQLFKRVTMDNNVQRRK